MCVWVAHLIISSLSFTILIFKLSELSCIMEPPYRALGETALFSRSILWQLQRAYFEKQGISAWQEGVVPHYVTSNPTIAKAYAEIILAVFRDFVRMHPDRHERIYILELGAGSGRLGYHLIKHLALLCEQATFNVPPFTYILSDFTQANVQFWKDHYKLKSFEEKGLLDYACFDAEQDTEVYLQVAGKTIKPGSLTTPLLIIANYFFDSIPHDLFYFNDESISEVLTNVVAPPHGETDTLSPETLNYEFILQPTSDTAYYPEEELNRLLNTYRSQLKQTYLLFPHIPIRCLERLRALSSDGFILLSADKGHQHAEEMDYADAPSLIWHGSFSLSVNYHAIRAFYEHRGALSIIPQHDHHNINILCLLMVADTHNYKDTTAAYYNYIERFGPDDFFNLKKHFERHIDSMQLWQLQSYLRLSGCDARFFKQCVPHLMDLLSSVNKNEAGNMRLLLYQIWDMYYPIGEQQDLSFDIACAFYQMDLYEDALLFFELSLTHYGASPVTYYNMASCYYQLEQDRRAKEFIEKTLVMDAAHEGALDLQSQLKEINSIH